MRTALRVLAVAGALAALAVVALVVAIATVDIGAFVDPLRARVKDATGRELAIGSVRFAHSLPPRLLLENVAFGNAPWGSAPQLLTARRVELDVALLPLLQRRLEVVRLALDEPVIALERRRDGTGNWVFAPPAGAPASRPAPAPPSAPETDGAPAPLAALGVGRLDLTRGTLTYRDHASGRLTTVVVDALALKSRGPRDTTAITLDAKVDGLPLALEGDLGSLEAMRQRHWPQRVSLRGEIGGRKLDFAAAITGADNELRLDDLRLAYGPNSVRGSLAIVARGARPKLGFDLAGERIDAAMLALPVSGPGAQAPSAPPAPVPASEAQAKRSWIFPDRRVDFAPLFAADIDGKVAIGELALADGRRVGQLRADLRVTEGRAQLRVTQATLLGGDGHLDVVVEAAREPRARVAVRLGAKGLALAELLAAAGTPRDVRGGSTDVDVDVAMQGESPRQWASTLRGTVSAIVGPATIVNAKLDQASVLDRLGELVNPFRNVDATTQLRCAVMRLPFAGGVARVDRGIALETDRVGVAASGTIDLRDETVDLALRPAGRAGVRVDLVRLADLVRLHGPLRSPTVAIDPKAAAGLLAGIGAAYASGGLSLAGEALLGQGKGGGECDVALGRKAEPAAAAAPAAPRAPDAAASPPGKAVEDAARTLRRLFGR